MTPLWIKAAIALGAALIGGLFLLVVLGFQPWFHWGLDGGCSVEMNCY